MEITKLEPRIVHLTPRSGVDVRRTIPHRKIRMIGAWCFLDHYGPTPQVDAMSVAAHPHAGLQTVSWLYSGEIEHCDSLGSLQRIRPGELNIMTSGHGIAHSERSIHDSGDLHGVQLWVALPEADRDRAPMFHHHKDLPRFEMDGGQARLIVGRFGDHDSGVTTFSKLVAIELRLEAGQDYRFDLDPEFEYGFHLASGQVRVEGETLAPGELMFSPVGRNSISVTSHSESIALLLGGVPFQEKIMMWWNFVGRTQAEIEQMREDWNAESNRFPAFVDSIGGRIPAPALPNVALKARTNQIT